MGRRWEYQEWRSASMIFRRVTYSDKAKTEEVF